MDERDQRTWVVVELSRAGEQKIEADLLDETLISCLDGAQADHPVFVPSVSYSKGNRTINIHLMEGYAFIASGLPEVSYFRLERTQYVNSVMSRMSANGIRALATIKDSDVEGMRKQLRDMVASDIEVGMPVRVLEGVYTGLEGTVLTVFEQQACVGVELRSIHLVITVPRISLETVEEIRSIKPPPRKIPVQICQEPLPEKYVDYLLGGLSESGSTVLVRLFQAAQEMRDACAEAEKHIQRSPITQVLADQGYKHTIDEHGEVLFEHGVIQHVRVVRT